MRFGEVAHEQATHCAYGKWVSPIAVDLIVSKSMGLGVVLDGDDDYWSEGRTPKSDYRMAAEGMEFP